MGGELKLSYAIYLIRKVQTDFSLPCAIIVEDDCGNYGDVIQAKRKVQSLNKALGSKIKMAEEYRTISKDWSGSGRRSPYALFIPIHRCHSTKRKVIPVKINNCARIA